MFTANIIYLGNTPIGTECDTVRRLMAEKFGREQVDKRASRNDWARWSIVLDWVRGAKSLLDVGTGQGTFINSLACANAAEKLTGIDIRNYDLYSELFPGFERIMMDAEKMSFPDDSFDVITCMEVIEHLPDGKLEKVLSELRRVAAKRLIISVPFCEPLPLSKYHCQQFTPARLKEIFPKAHFTLLLKNPVTRTPWIVIDEPQGSHTYEAPYYETRAYDPRQDARPDTAPTAPLPDTAPRAPLPNAAPTTTPPNLLQRIIRRIKRTIGA